MPESSKKRSEATEAIEKAVVDPDVPKIYANGFGVGMGNADAFIVFHRFRGNPVVVVNLSYTLAKTLSQRLGKLVADLEQAIDQTILTTDRIDEAVKPKTEKPDSAPEGSDDSVH